MKTDGPCLIPFLRWAGGKRWLIRKCASILRNRLTGSNSYIEPFLGSGAFLFGLAPERAIIGDINEELIQSFQAVARYEAEIPKRLLNIPVDPEHYLQQRSSRPKSGLQTAVRFIYLNRTCYGGLHRTNKKGQFNVPFGGGTRTPKPMIQDGTLRKAASYLRTARIQYCIGDFERTLQFARPGDIVYCDPTFRAVTRTGYDRYGPKIYSWDDQIRLTKILSGLYDMGCLVLMSTQAWNGLKTLAPKSALIEVKRIKGISPNACHQESEYLFVMDPESDWDPWDKVGNIVLPQSTRHRSTEIAA